MMSRIASKPTLAFVVAGIVLMSPAPFVHGQTGLERKILLQQDLDIPGYETLLVEVTLAPGGREGRHRHPGTLVAYIAAGELTLEQEGLPTRTYKAGESGIIKPGQVHEGINNGRTPIKIFATFIVEKGKPLATQVR
jgi:quercetin dioxygenase-like cupin family protein